jgi:hypothetical protein
VVVQERLGKAANGVEVHLPRLDQPLVQSDRILQIEPNRG